MHADTRSNGADSIPRVLRGTLAASVTPLLAGGAGLDEEGFGLLVEHYVEAGLDGVLAFGTNGEGVLFSAAERRRGVRLFVEAARGRLDVAAHCGAQTTAETVGLAADAAEAGATAVAVIGPPYFPLDEPAQLAHLSAAAHACAPLPFYVYEFARTSGYAIALDVLRRLQDDAPNLVGLKVSDTPWEAFEPYLSLGLDVFVGPESLIHLGLDGGAKGAVSALAAAFPEQVAAVVERPSDAGAAELATLRAAVERFPRQAAMKRILAARGVVITPDVRAPLRDLSEDEVAEFDAWLATVPLTTHPAH
jgi:dihydrodipicolinate synthase/N-acetylneuraminate lyase